MRKTILLIIGCIMAATAVGQVQKDRKFGVSEIFENGDSILIKRLVTRVITIEDGTRTVMELPPDTANLFIPKDPSKKYRGVIVWEEAKVKLDTLWAETDLLEPNSPRIIGVNMTVALNSGKPDISDRSFSFVTKADQLASMSFNTTIGGAGGRIEFWGERFNEPGNVHGQVQIYVTPTSQTTPILKGTANQSLPPLQTDLKRGNPTFRVVVPPGSYKVTVQNTGSGQFIIDNFRVYQYTLK